MTQISNSSDHRYKFLDALRGFAILGVIAYHCAYFSGWSSRGLDFAEAGAYGVQLFFMVSAFTIFMTLERGLSKEPALIRSFFIRRIFRIVPMFWVGIILYSFVPGREHYYSDWNIGPFYYFVTAILQQGWHPNYINTVVPGGWSIAVEAVFYIVAPLLFFWIKNWRMALAFLLFAVVLSTAANESVRLLKDHEYIFQQVLPDLSKRFVYQWFPNQLPAFACGILAYYVLKSVPDTFRSKSNGLLLLVAAIMYIFSIVGIGGHRLIGEHVFFTLGFVVLILSLAVYPIAPLVNFATCFLGRISYSCYLLHFFILQGLVPHFGIFSWLFNAHTFEAFVSLVIVTTVLTALVSWFTYTLIEQPFIRLGSLLARRLNSGLEVELKNRVVTA